MGELEESRRKLISLKMQKDGISGMHVPIPVPVIVPNLVNGNASPEKPADRTKRLRELKESIEEKKVFHLLAEIVFANTSSPVLTLSHSFLIDVNMKMM